MRLSRIGLVLSTIALSFFSSVVNASPRTFTLDCSSGRAAPSGVPSSLTSWSNLQVFRAWCDAAGTDTLVIEMSHTADLRLPESKGSSRVRVSNTIGLTDWMPAQPGNPNLIHKWALNGPWYGTINEWDSSLVVITILDLDFNLVFETPYPVASWLAEGQGGVGISAVRYNTKTRSRTRVYLKTTCPAHHSYVFVNTVTDETVGNLIDGGSCKTVKRSVPTGEVLSTGLINAFRE